MKNQVKKQVIVIEDDEAINDILTIMLTNSGYSVSSVRTGEYFADQNAAKPDLFLIDRNLPGINGIEICKQIKSEPGTRDIPVIMISASAGFVEPAKAAGADACIEKPFSRRELFDTIDHYINRTNSFFD